MTTLHCREAPSCAPDSPSMPLPPPGAQLQGYLCSHYAPLRRKLTHHLGNRDFATECLHETWIRLADCVLAAPVQSPEAYVYRMACNIAIDRLRSRRTREYLEDAAADPDGVETLSMGPETIAEHRSALEAMERAMQAMPARNRDVLMALRVEEKSRQEVAVRYGLSLRTVDTALRLALDYCADQLGRQASRKREVAVSRC